MIKHFKHTGLEAFFRTGSKRGIDPTHANRLKKQLAMLNACTSARDLQAPPGWKLHPLDGIWSQHWAISVSGNWRLRFKFDGKDVVDLDYLDYH